MTPQELIAAGLGTSMWLGMGLILMYLVDHSTDFQMGRDLIRRRRYLSPTGVMFWLCLLWPVGLVWYWRRWR